MNNLCSHWMRQKIDFSDILTTLEKQKAELIATLPMCKENFEIMVKKIFSSEYSDLTHVAVLKMRQALREEGLVENEMD